MVTFECPVMAAVNRYCPRITNLPQCNAWILQQHPIVSGDLLVEVGQQGDVDVAQASSLTKHHDTIPVRLTLDTITAANSVNYNTFQIISALLNVLNTTDIKY